VGSLKVGKDADVVIWNNHPLSMYAVAEKTIVDGIIYFDRERDKELRKQIQAEKARLIQKMATARRSPSAGGGAPAIQRARPRWEVIETCEEHYHSHGLLAVDAEEMEAIQLNK